MRRCGNILRFADKGKRLVEWAFLCLPGSLGGFWPGSVGLPIWLHLLKRHKTDRKPFPSLMFFEQREAELGEAPPAGPSAAVRAAHR